MMNIFGVSKYRRTRKHKLSILVSMVYLKSDGIPKLRYLLPFINQTRSFPLKQKANICLRHLFVLLLFGRVIHINNAFSMLLCCCCFATSLGAFYQHSTHCL